MSISFGGIWQSVMLALTLIAIAIIVSTCTIVQEREHTKQLEACLAKVDTVERCVLLVGNNTVSRR